MKFVHEWCTNEKKEGESGEEKKKVPLEWQTAYDMRPWTAFPER